MLAALVCIPGRSPAAPADPVRIMLLGDSITQGSEGDWTWRYRLWQHLTASAVDVDLVGYRDDLRDELAHTFGGQAYIDPAFDRDHAARWGMRLGALDVPVDELVDDFDPDVLVVELGDNDLSDGKSAEEVRDLLADLVTDARSASPGLGVVLVTDPRPTLQPEAADYNVLVEQLATGLDEPDARVVVADAADGYDENQDSYDGAHPNSHGELKIAAAVADALSELGVGPPATRPLPLDSTARGPRIAPELSAVATADGGELTWVRSPGSATSDVWVRDLTTGEGWHRVAQGVTGTSHTLTGLPARHVVEARTVPFKGFWEAEQDAWSDPVAVKVRGTGPARVLLVGDSVTIGSTGDWTWRYRLWKHLAATAPGLTDLVGPRTDLYDRRSRTYGHQSYVDPAFDRDHAAVWGRGVIFPAVPTGALVADHDADVVVEILGLNDLELPSVTPDQVAEHVRGLVDDARRANPDVDVVLGEVAQTWVLGAPELNALLHAAAADLDDAQSRVVVAETADGFARRADTYDDSHPNARGEVKIAAAVADALAGIGLGSPYTRPLPVVPAGPRLSVRLRGEVRDGRIVLKWSPSPGADSYRVLTRRDGRWRRAATTQRRHVTLRGLRAGRRHVFLVLPARGRDLAPMEVASNRVRLRL